MAENVARDLVLPGATLHADGSFSRQAIRHPVSARSDSSSSIVSRDVTIDDGLGLWARIFLPKRLKGECVDPNALKSPVLMYFHHGGGFVAMSARFFGFHDFCEEISRWLGVLVVSVEYRLAPENRLPVAYEDGFAALKWLGQDQGGLSDPWLAAHADLSSVFLVGDSSGANLVHHLSVRAAAPASWGDLGPVRIVGRVLIQPSFASVARKPSEMLRDDPSKVSPSTLMMDRFWELALPIGQHRGGQGRSCRDPPVPDACRCGGAGCCSRSRRGVLRDSPRVWQKCQAC